MIQHIMVMDNSVSGAYETVWKKLLMCVINTQNL